MTMSKFREELYQKLRFTDVELAEDLYRRMPEVTTLAELNRYWHQLLGQYEVDTLGLRMLLSTTDLEGWMEFFTKELAPFLVEHRLPPMTNRATPCTYADNLAAHMQAARA